ncbi:MAG TPA: HAMP domain-containing protein [Rhizobiales bacterium]|nr:HAMP domain-containing protein [Hyphomicrobiales bacterium]
MKLTGFGIRARMFAAFGLIALVTVISSIAAWVTYEKLSGSLNAIIGRDIPGFSLASELTARSSEIVATAPILAAVETGRARTRVWKRLMNSIHGTERLIQNLARHGIRGDRHSSLQIQLDAVSSALRSLDANVRRKFWFGQRNRELTERLRWAHADFLDEIDPLIDDAHFSIGLDLRRLRQVPGDSQGGIRQKRRQNLLDLDARLRRHEALLRLKASINLLVGLIFRAANADSPAELKNILLFAGEAGAPIDQDLRHLGKQPELTALRQSAAAIENFTRGPDSLFELRREALKLQKDSTRLLEESRSLVEAFQQRIASLSAQIRAQTTQASRQAGKITAQAKSLLIWAALGSIIIAILMVWLYVGRSLVGRISGLKTAMRRIAEGDMQAPVPSGGADEIADMASTLKIFRDTITETQRELVQAGKLAALGQLAAGVAHDLNQPLAALRFQAHNTAVNIKRGQMEEAAGNLDKISRLSAAMAKKINHLKTLARKPSRQIGEANLKTVISAALDLLQGRIRDEGVQVLLEYPDHDLFVRAGENRLEQVLLNVFGNALDAMKGAKSKTLDIHVRQSRRKTRIRVCDSGSGFDEETLSRIFDPFFTTKTVGEGLGLGLSISYNIIKDFGGSMKAQNQSPAGACFTITLVTAKS